MERLLITEATICDICEGEIAKIAGEWKGIRRLVVEEDIESTECPVCLLDIIDCPF
tara:strand:- start:15348 stop:15515 length:168 start_codon:yes stop_codon:yes gene_type:complete